MACMNTVTATKHKAMKTILATDKTLMWELLNNLPLSCLALNSAAGNPYF